MHSNGRRAGILAILVLGSFAPAGAAEPSAAVTPWVEAQAARVRLLAGADAAHPGKALLAGVEITMAEGWKTYWRNPGEAGVPPSFDWSGSSNTASIKVDYPAPMRLVDPAAEMIGYKTTVLFPIEVIPKLPTEAVELRLALEFAVCREICIPAQASLALTVPPAPTAGAPAPAIAAAMERVPRVEAKRRAGDPKLLGVTPKLAGPSPSLEIEAKFPGGGAGADVFIEAPDGLFVPMAKKLAGGSDGQVRFLVDLSRGGNAEELKGKELIVTLVSDSGASEVSVRLD
ncbi:MAG TPA: protein-disulfide reductase DsbD domain-containing protein [Hyphomicrobiaceae bacterium]|jgi:DsbC/DsbD-like thiol-disulfide interchange protein|nr:protein-disulfide reductase DsbD domain-containing protein [Hyphomicrobiaceae bacterium]